MTDSFPSFLLMRSVKNDEAFCGFAGHKLSNRKAGGEVRKNDSPKLHSVGKGTREVN